MDDIVPIPEEIMRIIIDYSEISDIMKIYYTISEYRYYIDNYYDGFIKYYKKYICKRCNIQSIRCEYCKTYFDIHCMYCRMRIDKYNLCERCSKYDYNDNDKCKICYEFGNIVFNNGLFFCIDGCDYIPACDLCRSASVYAHNSRWHMWHCKQCFITQLLKHKKDWISKSYLCKNEQILCSLCNEYSIDKYYHFDEDYHYNIPKQNICEKCFDDLDTVEDSFDKYETEVRIPKKKIISCDCCATIINTFVEIDYNDDTFLFCENCVDYVNYIKLII